MLGRKGCGFMAFVRIQYRMVIEMNLIMQEVPGLSAVELVIRYGNTSVGEAAALMEALQTFLSPSQQVRKLTGWQDGQAYPLDPEDVLYIDTVDRKTFLYTESGVYETDQRIYELEERLRERDFFRATKAMLVNFDAIRSLRPDLGGRLRLTMQGGETLYVSRQYAPYLKKKLGL